MLEEAGYKVSTHTDGEWKVTTPRGEIIVFKRDVGICNRMPYIDLREHEEGLVMLETVEKTWRCSPRMRCTASACSTAKNWAPHGRVHEANCKSAKSEEHPHQKF